MLAVVMTARPGSGLEGDLMKAETTRKLFRWHYLAGLVFGANLILLSVTGGILVFHDEIDAWMHPELTASADPSTAALPAGFAPILAELRGEHPGYRLRSLTFAGEDQANHRVGFERLETSNAAGGADPDAPKRVAVWIDPQSGEAVVEEDGFDLLHFIFQLHADLFLGRLGLLWLGVVSLALIFSSVTGLILYGPFMRQLAFGAIRRGSLNLSSSDIHKFVGLVSLGFQILMAVTGACLTLGTFVLQIYVYFELQTVPRSASGIATEIASADSVLEISREHFSQRDVRITTLLFPGDLQGDDYHLVLGETRAGLERFVPKALLLHRGSGAVAKELQLPWYIKMLALAQPFHFGNFGGLPMKILYFVLSFTTGGLAVTGYILYFVRRKKQRISADERSAA